MLAGTFFSLSDVARLLKKEGNRKLLKKLVRYYGIKHFYCGRDLIFDQEGVDALTEAVRAWDSRPRLSEIDAETESAHARAS
jgi:hypothetical protein